MTTHHPTCFSATSRARVFTPFVIISNSDDEIIILPIRPAPPSPDRIPALYGYPLDSDVDSSDKDLNDTTESLHTHIGRCNNYDVLQSIPCSPECKIVRQILLDHPLRYALIATADVLAVYLQQSWKTVNKVPDTELDSQEKKNAITHPRFTKLIIADLMKKYSFILKRLGEVYHSIKDDIPLVGVYSTGYVLFRGMLILDSFLTNEIRATDDYKEYKTVFLEVTIKQKQVVKGEKDAESYASKFAASMLDDEVDDSGNRATNDLIEENLKRVVANTVIQERDAFQSEVPALISKEFNAHAPKIIKDLFKHYVQTNVIQVHPNITTSIDTTDDDFHSQQNDDAPLEGEKRVKRHKKSKSSKSARGSSSKRSAKESTTYVTKQQHQQQEWDAWEEETVIDEDEVIPKDETLELITKFQNVDKRIPTIFDHARIEATLNDMLSNQFRNAEEYAYHLEQATNFKENQIVWESKQEDIRRLIPKALIFYRP
nr:hypothetical protein [Tanacetum cinerariifolium]